MYHSKTLLVKQGTSLYEVWPDLAEKRDILNTGFGHLEEFNIENLFIGELLLISENRTLHFSDSDLFMDGRKKENRAGKLRINGIVSRSVIYLSGSTQGSEF